MLVAAEEGLVDRVKESLKENANVNAKEQNEVS